MAKRPSLFAPRPAVSAEASVAAAVPVAPIPAASSKRPQSREGKRVLSVYLDPLALKQLRQLALDEDRSTQSLGEEALNLLFAKYGLNRSA